MPVTSKFTTPIIISNNLAEFLGLEKGTKMTRIEVTREINKYIRKNNLQDFEDRRKINPDAILTKLFKLNQTVQLTHFNIQRFITPHLDGSNNIEFDI
jgi:chromatin remodeling complex protein RSC6